MNRVHRCVHKVHTQDVGDVTTKKSTKKKSHNVLSTFMTFELGHTHSLFISC